MTAQVPGPGSGPASMKELIAVIRDITALTSRETDFLRAMELKKFAELHEKKMTLIGTYEEHTNRLRRDPDFASHLEPRLRDELTDATRRMHSAMEESRPALEAARTLNNRVATAIVEAVQSERPENARYSGDGDYSSVKNAPPLSVQLDGEF